MEYGDDMEINDENTVIEFKSTPKNFISEQLGVYVHGAKRNTTRFVQAPENARIVMAQRAGTLQFIRIHNTETGDTFLRKLTDFRQFTGDGVAFGWFCWLWSWS